jgi:hypothetical protein
MGRHYWQSALWKRNPGREVIPERVQKELSFSRVSRCQSAALGHERDGIQGTLDGAMKQDFFLSAAGLAGGAHHRRPVRSTLPALIFAKKRLAALNRP